MSGPVRKIIHVDCDAFYASVEMRDHPEWQHVPLAVGGRPENRGVIATCNYLARRFGVHSAMSSARALRLCPRLLLVPPDFTRYRAASQHILSIYREFTPLVEPLSLDEAYLDVTSQPHCQGSATLMAEAIRARICCNRSTISSSGTCRNGSDDQSVSQSTSMPSKPRACAYSTTALAKAARFAGSVPMRYMLPAVAPPPTTKNASCEEVMAARTVFCCRSRSGLTYHTPWASGDMPKQ